MSFVFYKNKNSFSSLRGGASGGLARGRLLQKIALFKKIKNSFSSLGDGASGGLACGRLLQEIALFKKIKNSFSSLGDGASGGLACGRLLQKIASGGLACGRLLQKIASGGLARGRLLQESSLIKKSIYLLIFLTLFAVKVNAQVSVRSNINKDAILIGEPISLVVEAYVPIGSDVTWFLTDSIPHFEITSRETIDTAQNIDNKKLSQTFDITSFDSGQQYIPPFEIIVDGQPYYTDSVLINVSYTPFDSNADYRDIKDIIDVKNPSVDYLHWILLTTAIICLLVIIMLYRKPAKKLEKTEVVPSLSPYEEAMQALAKLSARNINNGEVKIYYSEMNDILRKYVSRKFSFSTFERTNEELILEISRLGISRDAFSSLAQSLRMSDFVKFAKYQPSADDNTTNLKVVTSSIELLDKTVPGGV